MKIKVMFSLIFLLLLAFQCYELHGQTCGGDPVVPDEATAIKVAKAIWFPMFGKAMYKEKPFHADLLGDTLWVVYSTNPVMKKRKTKRALKENSNMVMIAGVMVAQIRKMDCKVLMVCHSK